MIKIIYPCANLECKSCNKHYLICKLKEKASTCPKRMIEKEGKIIKLGKN